MAQVCLQNVRLRATDKALFQVFVDDDQVIAVEPANTAAAVDEVFDAKGAVLLPTAVDVGASLQGPAGAHLEPPQMALASALQGGIGWLFPHVVDDEVAHLPFSSWAVLQHDLPEGLPAVGQVGLLSSGGDLAEMATARARGAQLVGDGPDADPSAELLFRAMQYARGLGLPVRTGVQCRALSAAGCVADTPLSTRLGLEGIPSSAETIRVHRAIDFAEETGASVVLGPLSCAKSADAIRSARERGVHVVGLVALSHLLLDESAHQQSPYAPHLHLSPPLRTADDRKALRALVVDGHAWLTSAHQAMDATDKEVPFDHSTPGGAGFDAFTHLTLSLDGTADHSALDVDDWVRACCTGPAAALGLDLGLDAQGGVQVGTRCALQVVRAASPDTSAHFSLPSPLEGQPCTTQVVATVCGGHLQVHDASTLEST